MAYNSSQIRGYGDQIMGNGGSYMDLMTAAQQYGVPLSQVAGAYGMSGAQGEQFLNSNGISADPTGRATYINSPTASFTPGEQGQTAGWLGQNVFGGQNLGAYDGSDSAKNDQTLGTMLASGRNMGDVRAMFPQFSEQQIGDYYTQHQDGINAARDDFMAGQGQPEQQASQPAAQGEANPYLNSRADDIQRRVQESLGQGLAGIAGQHVGGGSLGGSRMGVAQGQATGLAMDNLAGQLANMYSTDWNQGQNRSLQKYGMDQNFNLGQQGLNNSFYLGNQGQLLGSYTANRGLDQSQAELGMRMYGLGNSGDWDALQQFNGLASPYTGYGSSSSSTQGGGAMGALGGGLGGYQLWKGMGGSSSGSGRNPYDNSYGWGTGSNYGNQDYGQYF